jgi:thioredoxin reductase/ferredoxin
MAGSILDQSILVISNHLEGIAIGLFLLIVGFIVYRGESKQKMAQKVLDKAVKSNMNEPLTLHPEIDPAKCLGCGTCTKVCPEGDILQLIDHRAVLVAPTKCVGHGECERACPFGAISLVFGTKTRGVDIPRLNSNYETNVPGLYIAGELGGMGLIRNAIKQGYLAATHAIDKVTASAKALSSDAPTDTDILIVGAGPAGLGAALTAISQKKSYICIDQNSFGGTVFNFPRQKVVMSHPAQLPIVGEMKFKQNKATKEEVLAYWDDVRKKTGFKIRENVKFENLEGRDGHFMVTTSAGVISAKKVILAMGVRGSPRRLGLPNEDLPKVTYNLLDPDQYQNQDIVVVGGGNAAVETAQYLGAEKRKNRVTLLVRGTTFDRCNQENIDIVTKMRDQGLVDIWHEASVKEIQPEYLIITRNGTDHQINNSYVFVFIGAEMPHKFLMGLGVEIDKKFGEALQSTA